MKIPTLIVAKNIALAFLGTIVLSMLNVMIQHFDKLSKYDFLFNLTYILWYCFVILKTSVEIENTDTDV